MPSTPRRLAALACLVFAGLWIFILSSQSADVRVESKLDTVHVLPRTGLWFHEYRITVRRDSGSMKLRSSVAVPERGTAPESDDESGPAPSVMPDANSAQFERFSFRVTEEQYDALRTGERLKLNRLRFMTSFAWKSEESVMRGFVRALRARTAQYQSPRYLAPSLGSSPGLARVLSVHRVTPQRGALKTSDANASSSALDIVVVEFWAPRLRTVVRTVDVVNARSIDDLGPGQILQMHFDSRTPRAMRLDDGMRGSPP